METKETDGHDAGKVPISQTGLLWTPEDVASYLRIPKRTLYAWRYRRQGPPAMKVGRHLRYDPKDIQSWMAKQRQNQ